MMLKKAMVCVWCLLCFVTSTGYSGNCPPGIPFQCCVYTSVPFTNYSLNNNCAIIGNYSFGIYSTLFCYANAANTTGYLYWTYQNSPYPLPPNNPLPTPLQLVKNCNIPGYCYLADTDGYVAFYNNSGTTISASCALAL